MHFSSPILASVLLLALDILAAPERRPTAFETHKARDSSCMGDDEAQQVATNFKNLIVEYSDSLANSSLTMDFVDYSDSVIELINKGCSNSVQDVCETGLACALLKNDH